MSESFAGTPLDPGTTYRLPRPRDEPLRRLSRRRRNGPWSTVERSATTPVVVPGRSQYWGRVPANNPTTRGSVEVNSITIKWTAPTETGGAPITSYEIWVGLETMGQQTTENMMMCCSKQRMPPFRTCRLTPTEYKHIGLSRWLRTYHYRVRAVNSAGEEPLVGMSRPATTTPSRKEARRAQ